MLDLDNELVLIAKEWVQKAETDFSAATILMRARKQRPLESICFHAQQCVEKYLKTLLVVNEIEPPKTHSLLVIHELIPAEIRPSLAKSLQIRLSEYAVIARYPGDYDPIMLTDAQEAIKVMKRLRIDVRHRLPESVVGN